ncbi:MAG: MFS transporter [Chloroflexota bacterium]
MSTTALNEINLEKKWQTLWLLSIAELLGMAVWFSASAIVPTLTEIWDLTASGQAWLTMSVQIGFVVGAFISSLLNLADRISAKYFFAVSTFLAGVMTGLIPLIANGLAIALLLRFLTGMLLAGVYPVGMKLMATWTKKDRGLGIGLLVGALTIGSGLPHLLTLFGTSANWQQVLYLAASLAIIGSFIGIFFIQEGPYKTASPPFDWKQIGKLLSERPVVLANLGYLGHMWELYAMWAWISIFLAESFRLQNVSTRWASLVAFGVLAVGGVGSYVAGVLADKYGRTQITTISLITSGSCAVLIGFLFGGNPILLTILALVWGFAIVADSAQFSAAVSELSPKQFIGTALTLQTSLGFLLTLFTIRLIPPLVEFIGWQFAFTLLAIGPVVGIWAMQSLRKLPEANKLANGRK